MRFAAVLSSPDPDPTSSPGSSRFPRGSEKTLETRLVQTVDWCLGVSLALGFCAITDCVMEMSRDKLTPQGFPHRVLVSALQVSRYQNFR